MLSAPARRALESNGVTSLQQLSTYSEKEILKFHGMGPASLPKLGSFGDRWVIIQSLINLVNKESGTPFLWTSSLLN